MTHTSRPNVDLSAPDVRVMDLDGDGIPDALRLGASGATFFKNLGEGKWAPGVHVMGSPPYRLDDPHVHLAGIKGDGFPDLVKVSQGRIEVYPGLGKGRFGSPFIMQNAPKFGAGFNPRYVRFADLTGSGQADLLYIEHNRVTAYFNQAGLAFAEGVALGHTRLSSQGHIEPVDLYGNGASGLLVTDRKDLSGTWRYLDLFPDGTPDLLESIDNGLGASTTITYGNSAAHCLRDRAALEPWQSHMPFVQRVVDKVEVHDTLSDLRLNTRYTYHHGVYDGREREFRGFGRVQQYDTEVDLDPDHDSSTTDSSTLLQAMTKSWFHCGTDLNLSEEYYEVSGYAALEHVDERPSRLTALRALRGLPLRQETYTTDDLDTPYSVSESVYRVHELEDGSVGKPSDAPLAYKARSIYTERLSSAEARVMETETLYDLDDPSGTDYGLPTKVTETGYGKASSDGSDVGDQMAETLTRVRTSEYHTAVDSTPTADYDVAYDSGTEEFYYLVGFVKKTQLQDSSSSVLAEEQYFYDGDDYEGLGHPSSTSSAAVEKGLLKCKLVLAMDDALLSATYPSGEGDAAAFSARGNYLTDGTDHYIQAERYSHTDEGLVATAKGPGGGTVTFEYDSTYELFPIKATDALSHPTEVSRGELLFRVESSLDANGNTTTYGYDVTGLPAWIAVKGKFDNTIASDWDGDTDSSPTQQFSYDFTTSPIQIVVKTRQVRGGATFDVYRYVDGMGRTLQERHTAEPDPDTSVTRFRVTGWVETNAKGQPYRAYQPYFDSSSAFSIPSTTDKPFVETTYDPLGRATRVDYPDGTYESTSFHPWYQSFYDRNDNASAIDAEDERYGDFLGRFKDHLNTPTVTYFDAFGRQIAVSEDVGKQSETDKSFRITTYEVPAGQFTGTSYELPLQQALSEHYFVMLQGSVNVTGPDPANANARVSSDPHGNFSGSTDADKLELTRGASNQGDWVGSVTVWECLGDVGVSGFQLIDVVEISAGTAATQTTQSGSASSSAWTDVDQVVIYGGVRGGGVSTSETAKAQFGSTWATLSPSGTGSNVLWERYNEDSTLEAATFTAYVVQWGSEHSIQRVAISGNAGAAGADSSSAYDTQALATAVDRSKSWVWASGYTHGTALQDGFTGISVALGDGVTVNESESSVSAGAENAIEKELVVSVHSHPDFDVDWQFKEDGDSTATTYTHDVPGALASEVTSTSTVNATAGTRALLQTQTSGGTVNANYQRVLWRARHEDQGDGVVDRVGGGTDWTAWVQSLDAGLLEHAVARPIAEPDTALRVTTYQLGGTTFSGTTYDLSLNDDLAKNYFVMVIGAEEQSSGARADGSGVRVSADPFGTGDLSKSSADDVLSFERGGSTDPWHGTIVVVECLADEAAAGFRLLDVVEATCAGGSTGTPAETTSVTSRQAWEDLGQVAVYGGPRGGGASVASADHKKWASLAARIVPSGDEDITLTRLSQLQGLLEATFTLYVVEWGVEHNLQRVSVSGTAGGSGASSTSHYNTATISEVDRDGSWVWASGYTASDNMDGSFFGQLFALGDGVNQSTTETSVAVGDQVGGVQREFSVLVHSHPSLAVDHVFLSQGNNVPTTRDATVDAAAGTETYNTGTPTSTDGTRVGVWTTSNTTTGMSGFAKVVYFPRFTASTTLTGTRAVGNKETASWVQSVETDGVVFRRKHVTRTVFDLKDQPIEVWDARGLDDATWEFSYDYVGQRIKTAHLTAMGTRYALADAAGNPIWSRDARGVEVDRVFDTLNRPTTVTSDDGTTAKLRRQFTYIAYSATDTASMAKNLFGRVEEARDADGLRFFEYDWRGLVTTASHKFWDQADGATAWNSGSHSMWATGFAWDPAIPSGARSGLSNFLSLADLGTSGTDTVQISTTYDAAGRPTQVDYPEDMSLRMSYNKAGLLESQELQRTSSSGWQTIVEDCEYNARGQVSYFKHGNGVETTREYDSSLERLERIFTELTGTTPTRFQDLRYGYDPVGNPVKITDALRHDRYRSNQLIPNSRSFWYDGRYRLTRATGRKRAVLDAYGEAEVLSNPDENDYEGYDYRYTYDQVGNFWKNHEYSTKKLYYKANRLDLFNGTDEGNTAPGSGNWTYDANGNTLHTPRHKEMRYTFDSQPRFVDMDGGGAVHYFRHADQRVVRMVRKGTSGSQFGLGIYLGPWEYQESATEGWSKIVLHCEGHGRHAQAEVVHDGTDSTSEDVFFNHGDHLGSGHVLTKDDGTLLSQEEYFPYGKASDRRDERNRYRFIGVERDEATGLSVVGPRFYDQAAGRFLQVDPVEFHGASPFSYAGSSPIALMDRTGYAPEWVDRALNWTRTLIQRTYEYVKPAEKPQPDPLKASRNEAALAALEGEPAEVIGITLIKSSDGSHDFRDSPDLGANHRNSSPGPHSYGGRNYYGVQIEFNLSEESSSNSVYWKRGVEIRESTISFKDAPGQTAEMDVLSKMVGTPTVQGVSGEKELVVDDKDMRSLQASTLRPDERTLVVADSVGGLDSGSEGRMLLDFVVVLYTLPDLDEPDSLSEKEQRDSLGGRAIGEVRYTMEYAYDGGKWVGEGVVEGSVEGWIVDTETGEVRSIDVEVK
ncbi:MAG: toxin TcdB middle/N-terminal domain-containing protein [Myxococcota bacterium]|nr:toxin TcdB middle/N-terminal domain-containing protein [Myxococcota bacterium]